MAWRIVGWVVIVIATLSFFYWARAALPPFLIGGVIALLLNPLVETLINKRALSRSRAVFNVFVAFLLLTTAIGVLLAPGFYSQAQIIIKEFAVAPNGNGNGGKTNAAPPDTSGSESESPPSPTDSTVPNTGMSPSVVSEPTEDVTPSPETPSEPASGSLETGAPPIETGEPALPQTLPQGAAPASQNKFITRIQEFAQNMEGRIESELQNREHLVKRNEGLLKQMGLPAEPKALAKEIRKIFDQRVAAPVKARSADLLQSVLNVFLGLLSKILWLILIPLITYLFLLEMDNIQRAFLFLIPPGQRMAVSALLDEIGRVFLRYLRGLVTVALLYGTTSGIVFWLLGVPNPVLVGALAGVLYPVPYVGAALTALLSGGFTYVLGPAHPLLFAVPLSPPVHAIVIVLCGAAMNVAFDMIITPRVLGDAVGLNPLASMFAILVGAQTMGIWGMLLAVPVATTLKIIIERMLYFSYGEADFLSVPVDTVSIEVIQEASDPTGGESNR